MVAISAAAFGGPSSHQTNQDLQAYEAFSRFAGKLIILSAIDVKTFFNVLLNFEIKNALFSQRISLIKNVGKQFQL